MEEPELITAHPQFFTATCLEWKPLLKPDKYKDIIVDSLCFFVKQTRVIVYGFVIMPNHIHLIWQMRRGHERQNVQRDFLKFTAQSIKEDLKKNHPPVLKDFRVNAKDRTYQFWERNPLSVDIYSEQVAWQKLNYLHFNPVKAGLCLWPEEYRYSSADFYHTGVDERGFLSHILG